MSDGAVMAAETFDCRVAFASTLDEMAEQDERVCAVVNDSVGSTKLKEFRDRFPERFVNVGIAEQNMVGASAGLANGGMIPFCCGASCFLTARSMEQVKVDLGYAKNNVKLCGMSSGMAYGELGPTHHRSKIWPGRERFRTWRLLCRPIRAETRARCFGQRITQAQYFCVSAACRCQAA